MKNFITILALSTLLFSCNRNKEARFGYGADESMANKVSLSMDVPPTQQPELIDRMLIRQGNLDMKVKDVKATKAEIEKIVTALNGYIASENESNYGDRIQYMQSIRVPAAAFDELIKKIEVLGKTIENKNINTQDVTEEFIDVEARLKTKKELEARYLELLKQAKSVADIVSIEGQLNQVRAEIESMEGRLKYLKSQVSYSTLTVNYYEPIGAEFGFFGKVKESVGNGWENLLAFFIGIVNVWPFVLVAVGLVFWWIRRKRKAKV